MDFKIGDEVVLTGEDWAIFGVRGDIVEIVSEQPKPLLYLESEGFTGELYAEKEGAWRVELYVPGDTDRTEIDPGKWKCCETGRCQGGSEYPATDYDTSDGGSSYGSGEKDLPPDKVNLKDDLEGEPVKEDCCETGECWYNDAINPNHYQFPGGVEVIQISQWLTSNSAQALQYIARSSRIDGKNKGDTVEDLQKAIRFLEQEVDRLGS